MSGVQSGRQFIITGEAHLFAAIAKVDGVISKDERGFAPFHADQGSKLYELFNEDTEGLTSLRNEVVRLFEADAYALWDSERHLAEAIDLFRRSGGKALGLIGFRHGQGLLNVAKLDGYLMNESRFLIRIKEALSEFE